MLVVISINIPDLHTKKDFVCITCLLSLTISESGIPSNRINSCLEVHINPHKITLHPNETQELSVTAGDSDLDSMPELEDEIDISNIDIPLWLIPQGVMIAFRGGRMVFERDQGPPWQEVLAQMLEEQEATATNN